ncbi:glycosyltransferase [Thioclava sp. SK-1]|uniref:glycosyltransferase n=1 Tax=Thioclava sp. SK-1 TaxID=1889770 RepID=UPI002101CE83|nr:glycosyltransferase [Thioclava sp. SK-1]
MQQHDAQSGAETLVAVVVTCNRLNKLQVTLARLLDCPDAQLAQVVVVDNASDDGTSEWLAGQVDPRLVVLRETVNSGGAGGFARGMRVAVERFAPDWLVVMDDDGRPEPGALAAFHALDKTGYEGIAAAVYFPDGQICDMNRPSRNPFWQLGDFWRTVRRGRGGFHLPPAAYDLDRPSPIDVTSFVGFFISRAGIVRAGFPDPSLFIYGDDGIYTLGLAARGGRMCFDPRVRFEHDMGTFSGQQRGQFHPLWKAYYYHRNLLILYRQAAGCLFWPALLVILPKWFLKTRMHSGARKAFALLMVRAVRDGLLRRTTVSHSQVLRWGQTPD